MGNRRQRLEKVKREREDTLRGIAIRATAECLYCGLAIVWGVTEEGHDIPLDPGPAVYDVELEEGTVSAIRDHGVMVAHSATCRQMAPTEGD